MKNKMKKMLGIILSLVLVLGLMPRMNVAVYAQELTEFASIDNVNVGDIIGADTMALGGLNRYTITLLANRHGDANGNVITHDTVLNDADWMSDAIYSGGNRYYPCDEYGRCEAFVFTAIDHDKATATLGGYTTDSSVLLNREIKYCYNNGSTNLSGSTPAEATYQVNASSKNWTNDRWYVVTDNVTLENRISIRGTVRLVLCDGVTLDAPKGISLNSGSSLIIYGQANGTGTLNAASSNHAGIGSENERIGGDVTINSGTVYATGGYLSAGIGGGNYGSAGNVTLNGGTVIATGGNYTGDAVTVGIGHGYGGGDGSLIIGEGVVLKGSDNNSDWIDITDTNTRKRYMRTEVSDSGSGSSSSGSTDGGSGSSSSSGSSDSGNTSGGTSSGSSDNTNTNTDTSAKVPYADVATTAGAVNDITSTAAVTAESNPFGAKIENNSNLTALLSLTDAEVAQGVNAWLGIQDMSASVSQTDKTLIQSISGDYTVGLYFDINLFKKVGGNDATKVTETNGKLQASIVIPESMWKAGRTFEIIRVHDGVATDITGTYDENTHVFTFETDKFSTYALAYKDLVSLSDSSTTSDSSSSNSSNSTQSSTPKTGDPNDIRVWYLLLLASLGRLGFLGFSKKKKVND